MEPNSLPSTRYLIQYIFLLYSFLIFCQNIYMLYSVFYYRPMDVNTGCQHRMSFCVLNNMLYWESFRITKYKFMQECLQWNQIEHYAAKLIFNYQNNKMDSLSLVCIKKRIRISKKKFNFSLHFDINCEWKMKIFLRLFFFLRGGPKKVKSCEYEKERETNFDL